MASTDITFTFRLDKLIHALAFFSQKGVSDLTKLKAAKLLYFADKEHLLKYGRPILGDTYYCLPYGPVPSVALNEMSDAIAGPEVSDESYNRDTNLFRSILEVRRPMFSYPVFRAKQAFDPDVFSDSELEVLENTLHKYGRYTARKLVDLTHEEPTWQIANECRNEQDRAPIPYELFFKEAQEDTREILDVVVAEQEDSKDFDKLFASLHSLR